jgi:uncharacterized protein
MWRCVTVTIALCAVGCEWGGGTDSSGLVAIDAAPYADAPAHHADAVSDAAVDGGATDGSGSTAGGHLLLTEIALAPGGGEFIEIYNPTANAVDLSTYYLSDNGNYFKLPAGAPAIGIDDFIVQFPAAASITPAGVVTVATGTAALFTTAYGAPPTYSIADATITHVVIDGTPSLTDAGEIVVLFQWDGTSALVKDVDIMLAGAPTATNGLVSKSGLAQGNSAYATDANTIANQAATPAAGVSTKRILPETGHETQAGVGNGITGDDETSEDTSVTWDSTFTAPTPGTVPAGL